MQLLTHVTEYPYMTLFSHCCAICKAADETPSQFISCHFAEKFRKQISLSFGWSATLPKTMNLRLCTLTGTLHWRKKNYVDASYSEIFTDSHGRNRNNRLLSEKAGRKEGFLFFFFKYNLSCYDLVQFLMFALPISILTSLLTDWRNLL